MAKVLIVEDSMIVSFHIRILLEGSGYEVVACLTRGEDVEDAFKFYKPDIILLDVMLDGTMSGIEAAVIIRKSSACPIIFMSALSDVASLEAIQHVENTFQIGKPFDDEDVLRTIREATTRSSFIK